MNGCRVVILNISFGQECGGETSILAYDEM